MRAALSSMVVGPMPASITVTNHPSQLPTVNQQQRPGVDFRYQARVYASRSSWEEDGPSEDVNDKSINIDMEAE
jgi:hypothetical protein